MEYRGGREGEIKKDSEGEIKKDSEGEIKKWVCEEIVRT